MKLEAKIERLLAMRRRVSELETEIAADLHLNGFAARQAPEAPPPPAGKRRRKRAKVTAQMDTEIRVLKKRGNSIASIAETLGVSKSTVNYVLYVKKAA